MRYGMANELIVFARCSTVTKVGGFALCSWATSYDYKVMLKRFHAGKVKRQLKAGSWCASGLFTRDYRFTQANFHNISVPLSGGTGFHLEVKESL